MKSTFDDAMLSASFGRTQGQAADLRNSVRGLGQSSTAGLTQEQKNRRLRDACEGFESIFIQKMWQQMRATLPKEGLLKGREEAYWQDMYDQELAKSMTSAGGIGLADMMFEQLSRNLVSASRTTASATAPRRTAFTADAAPLLPPSPELPDAAEKQSSGRRTSVTASIYEGSAPQEGLVPQAAQEAQQKAQAAAQPAPAAGATPPAAPAAQNPPEVEQALAVLRSQQTVHHVQTTSNSRRSRSTSRRSAQLTGLQMAQQAQREAGDKLGNGVRPSSLSRRNHTPVPTAGQLAAANANAAQAPAESALPPLTAASAEPNAAAATAAASAPAVAAAQLAASQQQPQQEQQASVRRVRYTTNLPKQKRRADKEDLIRVLNMDSPQPSISNAAGAAAYQQQAAAAAQATAAPQGNPAMPNSRAQAVRDSAALKQMMEARESGQAGTPVVTTGPLAPLTGA